MQLCAYVRGHILKKSKHNFAKLESQWKSLFRNNDGIKAFFISVIRRAEITPLQSLHLK